MTEYLLERLKLTSSKPLIPIGDFETFNNSPKLVAFAGIDNPEKAIKNDENIDKALFIIKLHIVYMIIRLYFNKISATSQYKNH